MNSKRFLRLSKQLGLRTQLEIAEHIRVDPATVSRWITSDQIPELAAKFIALSVEHKKVLTRNVNLYAENIKMKGIIDTFRDLLLE